MAKKKVSQVNKEEEAKQKEFIDKYDALTKELGYKLVAMQAPVNNGKFFGTEAVLGLSKIEEIEIKADPKPDAE